MTWRTLAARDSILSGLVACCALAIALCGCNGGADDSAGAEVETLGGRVRLDLEATRAPSQPRTRVRLEPGVDPAPWEARGQFTRVNPVLLESGDEVLALIAIDPKERVFVARGEFDLRGVNEVAVEVHCGGLQTMSTILYSGAKEVARLAPLELAPSGEPARYVLRMPWPRPKEPSCDRIALHFSGTEPRVGLLSLELIERPPSAFTTKSGGPELVFAEGEGRRGVWTSTENPRHARTPTGARSELVFSYLQPTEARTDARASLVASVRAEGAAAIERRFDLGSDSLKPSRWRDARIPLGELAGRTVEVEFSLDSGGDGEAACVVAEAALYTRPAKAPPSVLLITSDTHRADHVGYAESGIEVSTPALDELARRGIAFTRCFASTNSTNPSHIAIMTGTHPRDTGILDQQTPLADVAPTLAEWFHASGYATWASISARHLRPATSGLGQGFERFAHPPNDWERRASLAVDDALRWLDTAPDGPVFLWLHVFDAHFPYAPPDEFDRRYYPADKDPFDPALGPPPLPERVLASHRLEKLRDLQYQRAQYRAEIDYVDEQLARVLELPRFKEGVVGFAADHGECLTEHNVFLAHTALNPVTLHVPMVVAWPDAPAGARCDATVTQVDLGRTLLDLAGLGDVRFPGRDLREALREPETDPVPHFAVGSNRMEASVTLGNEHLIVHLRDHFETDLVAPRVKHEVELYDLASDPECKQNLVTERLPRAKALRASVLDWLSQQRGLPWAGARSTDAELLLNLAALGYTTVEGAEAQRLWAADDCEWCQRFR